MNPTTARISQAKPKRRSHVSSIEERIDHLAVPQDPGLIRSRQEHDRAMVQRIVENEGAELLPRLAEAARDAEQAQFLLSMALWSGSDHEDALRLSLRKLAASAS